MDTELVKRAQHGDRDAFGLIAAELATRFLAVSRRILRDLACLLCRGPQFAPLVAEPAHPAS